MPDLPQFDVSGIVQLFTLILTSLAVMWGINKAVIIAKDS